MLETLVFLPHTLSPCMPPELSEYAVYRDSSLRINNKLFLESLLS